MISRGAIVLLLSISTTSCGTDPATTIEDTASEPALTPPAEAARDHDPRPGQLSPRTPDPAFDAPLPTDLCPETLVRIAHRERIALPSRLTEGVAYRAADGRHVRVVLSDRPITLGEHGRIEDPGPGHARFEMEAIRQRRRPLEPRILGGPDSANGGLSHARIVSSGPLLTFGHREVGTVELTRVDGERVCGRIDLDDGFGRVRGGFNVPVTGPLPP